MSFEVFECCLGTEGVTRPEVGADVIERTLIVRGDDARDFAGGGFAELGDSGVQFAAQVRGDKATDEILILLEDVIRGRGNGVLTVKLAALDPPGEIIDL